MRMKEPGIEANNEALADFKHLPGDTTRLRACQYSLKRRLIHLGTQRRGLWRLENHPLFRRLALGRGYARV